MITSLYTSAGGRPQSLNFERFFVLLLYVSETTPSNRNNDVESLQTDQRLSLMENFSKISEVGESQYITITTILLMVCGARTRQKRYRGSKQRRISVLRFLYYYDYCSFIALQNCCSYKSASQALKYIAETTILLKGEADRKSTDKVPWRRFDVILSAGRTSKWLETA